MPNPWEYCEVVAFNLVLIGLKKSIWRSLNPTFTCSLSIVKRSGFIERTDPIAIASLPYTLVNLRSGFNQDLGKWQVSEFLRIDNVTDKTYVSNVKVNSTTPFEPGLPLNATLGVNVSYKF